MDSKYDRFVPPEKKEAQEEEPWWNRARSQGQQQPQMQPEAQQQFRGQMQGVPASAGVPQGYGYEDEDEGFSPVKMDWASEALCKIIFTALHRIPIKAIEGDEAQYPFLDRSQIAVSFLILLHFAPSLDGCALLAIRPV